MLGETLHTLAVDIGGTGIKVIVLDEQGTAISDRIRLETPRPATPSAVLDVIKQLAEKAGSFDRVSVGFPGVVRDGITETAANLDKSWVGHNLAQAVEMELGRPVRVANDADVQGFGVIRGHGVELVLTLGTGLGSALFVTGNLVPNLEVAHHRFRAKRTYEEHLGNAALEFEGKKKWNKRLFKAIDELEKMFNFDHLYLGGGNAKKVTDELPKNVEKVSNIAGLLGGIALWRDL
ncbi:MAG: ROK family protein [Planctomycetota bacterium]